jgi:hypothetical protein
MPPAVFNRLRRVNWLLLDISLYLPDRAAWAAAVSSFGKRRTVRLRSGFVSLAVICDHS